MSLETSKQLASELFARFSAGDLAGALDLLAADATQHAFATWFEGSHAVSSGPDPRHPVAVSAAEAPPRAKQSNYPEPFASRMARREKRPLGDVFGLTNFGVNLTRLAPGGVSALRHAHSKQDEFVYVLSGHPVLVTDAGETPLSPGRCAGFRAGTGDAHHLVNRSEADVVFLEVGDRTAGDAGTYPDDDIQAVLGPDGRWKFAHKSGTPY